MTLILCFVLALATLTIYAQTFRFGFIAYDDDQYVYNNPVVEKGLTSSGLTWAFTTFHCSNWHPLTWLSHMLDCSLFGVKAGLHRVTNALFHAVNALLLFIAFLRMTGRVWRSFIVAGIFAVHPVHVESVAWIAERKDVLSAFLGLVALLLYVGYVRKPSKLKFAAVAAAFALALMAKPMLVTFPFVLLLMDVWPLGRLPWLPRWRALKPLVTEKAVLFALTAAACVSTFVAQKWSGAVQALANLPFSARLENALIGYVTYVAKSFWPSGLAVMYPFGVPSVGMAIVSLFAIAAVTVATFMLAKKRPYLAVGWLWFLGMLVPVIGIVQVGGQSTADRYMYLPLVGLSLAVVWLVADIVEERALLRRAAAAIGCVALIVLAGLAWRQASYWVSSKTLFEHTLAVTKGNFVIHNNLGVILNDEGRFSDAVSHFMKAVDINPAYVDAQTNLHKLAALRRDPAILENLGVLLVAKGLVPDAVSDFSAALDIDPNFADAQASLGRELLRAGKLDEAKPHLAAAVRALPGRADIRASLGLLLATKGDFEGARVPLQEAVALAPNDADTQNNLGFVLQQLGRVDEAISHYMEALHIKPDNANAHYNLATAFMDKENREQAIAELTKALAVDPGHAAARALLDKLQKPK